jgi:hypothetical protein
MATSVAVSVCVKSFHHRELHTELPRIQQKLSLPCMQTKEHSYRGYKQKAHSYHGFKQKISSFLQNYNKVVLVLN